MEHQFTAALLPVDDLDAANELYRRRGWSDGLPVVPPTVERVRAMLRHTDRHPDDLVATLPPAFGDATVERIAINAVLAGCGPRHLPMLIAAVEAVAEPVFNLQAIQATTNPATVMLVVSGPAARALDVNSGYGCLGPGAWANATLGRALRLILMNVGGARPGEMDRATHGQPGKYTFCFAENEVANPWEPLRAERGFAPATSTVTAVGVSSTLNLNTHTKDGDEFIRVFAASMVFPTSNDYTLAGEPWLILCPEHANVLARAGLSKTEVKRRLWEGTHLAASEFSRIDLWRLIACNRPDLTGPVTADTRIALALSPDQIGIVVAGGAGGTHSVYLPSFGDTRSVTRAICDASGESIQFNAP